VERRFHALSAKRISEGFVRFFVVVKHSPKVFAIDALAADRAGKIPFLLAQRFANGHRVLDAFAQIGGEPVIGHGTQGYARL
jgi:hypothetical protein